jgi:glycerol uptake facilitator-like aquaporin
MFGRQKVAMMVAEFLSAATLSMVVLALIARTNFPFFVAIASGLTVGLMAYLFNSHSNPAVTVGLWTMRKVQTLEAVVRVAMQMLGGVAAWQLSQYLVNSDLKNIAGDSFDWRILLAEALGAFVLGIGVAVAVKRAYEGARFAVTTGAALTLGILVASLASNALVNPAVAVGVHSWSWAYVLGPILGGVIGTSLYGVVFVEPATVAVQSVAVRKPATKKAVVKKPAARKRK